MHMATLTIATATKDDLDRYIDLLEELAEWMHGRGIVQWPRGRARNGRDYYEASIDRHELHLAFVAGEFAGGLRILKRDPVVWPDVIDDDALYLYTLAVRRTFSGRGVGRELLAWAEQQVTAAGRRYLRLDCVPGNAFLRRYYEDGGFIARGEIDAVYPGLAEVMPLRRYEKAVEPSWR
jgi:ribosomal protein S18 acetylase RimI-like enzyme